MIIVTPEYNGGYPASLKNVIDLLYAEWKKKPIALATASNGQFGGAQVTTSLVFSLWKIGLWTVQDIYDEYGIPIDKAATEKKAKPFIDELLWCMEASMKMETRNTII